ncbi:MAG: hypothetical protein QGG40_01455 [Myxococcota bacterium]|nr:hypothetical protein [Myxococcota bacterium]
MSGSGPTRKLLAGLAWVLGLLPRLVTALGRSLQDLLSGRRAESWEELHPEDQQVLDAKIDGLASNLPTEDLVADWATEFWVQPGVLEARIHHLRGTHSGSHGELSDTDTDSFPVLQAPAALPRSDTHRPERICIDLGTRACTIGQFVADAPPRLARFVSPVSGEEHQIGSDLAFPRPGTQEPGEGPAVLGTYATLLAGRNDPRFQYYRSIKRLIAETPRHSEDNPDWTPLSDLKPRVAAVVQELLLLALAPEISGTLRLAHNLEDDPQAHQVRIEETGLPEKKTILRTIERGGLEVFVCVPNAYGAFEEEILREATHQAARQFVARATKGGPETFLRIRLVREAEAIAWWTLHAEAQSAPTEGIETWLVYDMGGGSTDSAVVEVHTLRRHREVRLLHSTGVAFGGDEVDHLLLHQVARTASDTDIRSIDTRIVDARSTPTYELALCAQEKIAWSAQASDRLRALKDNPASLLEQGYMDGPDTGAGRTSRGGAEQAARSFWPLFYAWLLEPGSYTGPYAKAAEDIFGSFRVPAGAWSGSTVYAGDLCRAYARFLRAVTEGIVRSLQDRAGGDLKVDRVLISGRGSLAVGVRPLLTRLLELWGCIQRADQVGSVPGVAGDGGDATAMKLACVRGIAVSSPFLGPDTTARELGPTVSWQTPSQRTPLWSEGHRLTDHRLHARLTLDADLESRQPVAQLPFHLARCPRAVIDSIGGDDRWAYRLLGFVEIPTSHASRLHFVYNARARDLHAWSLQGHQAQPHPLSRAPTPRTNNPITQLPYGWSDPSRPASSEPEGD